MCGRLVATTGVEELVRFLVVDERRCEEQRARYNLAPTDASYLVRSSDGRRVLAAGRWGIDDGTGRRLINARAETVHRLPVFREHFAQRRCIVPADGFYEWRTEGALRHPYYLSRADGQPLALAGVCAEDGSFAVITTSANDDVTALHDRMPVVLDPGDWHAWLDPATVQAALRALLAPAARGTLHHHPVSPLVNNVRNDGPQLVAAAGEPARQLRLL